MIENKCPIFVKNEKLVNYLNVLCQQSDMEMVS